MRVASFDCWLLLLITVGMTEEVSHCFTPLWAEVALQILGDLRDRTLPSPTLGSQTFEESFDQVCGCHQRQMKRKFSFSHTVRIHSLQNCFGRVTEGQLQLSANKNCSRGVEKLDFQNYHNIIFTIPSSKEKTYKGTGKVFLLHRK